MPDTPNEKVEERITKEYADVAVAARIKGTNRDATGVVLKADSAYSGYKNNALWGSGCPMSGDPNDA